jgi:hypothetical protein
MRVSSSGSGAGAHCTAAVVDGVNGVAGAAAAGAAEGEVGVEVAGLCREIEPMLAVRATSSPYSCLARCSGSSSEQ